MRPAKLQTFIMPTLLVVGVCLCFAEEEEEKKAVEKAIEEANVVVEQLSFDKNSAIALHLERGEKFLALGEIDKEEEERKRYLLLAEAEFKAVREIAPDESTALIYLKDIRDIREKMREEDLLKDEEERKNTLAKIREEKRREKRESKISKRKRIRTTEEQIDEYMRQGKEYYAQGKYAEAVEEWQKVLPLTHPSDRDHRRMLNWISAAEFAKQQRREEIARAGKEESEDLVYLDVKKAWSVKEFEAERIAEKIEEIEGEISPAQLRLQEKARQLITVNFENAHLRTVLRQLSKLSGINIVLDESVFPFEEETLREIPAAFEEEFPAENPAPYEEGLRPDGGGRPTLLLAQDWPGDRPRMGAPGPRPPGGSTAAAPAARTEETVTLGTLSPRVTIQLKDIPLIEALDVILRTKGLDYKIEENIIWITTIENLEAGELVTKSYRPAGGIGDIVDMLRSTVPFEGGEVDGPPRSKITVDRTSGTIFITNIPMYHRLAEDIIRKLATTPPQASIETRFIDIDVSELAQLGIQWEVTEPFEGSSSDSYIGGTSFDSGGKPTTGIGTNLGVTETAYPSGMFLTYTKLTPTQFQTVMQAFEDSEKTNLLSAPKITVLNNYTGTIDITRGYPYIESYSLEEETIEIFDDDFKISTAVPEISERNIGVMLEVTPGIGADRKLINLTLAPQVVELVDWIEYTVVTTTLSQPIFLVRYVTTNVDINDGETLVLGGLIKGEERESTQQIPFLGRIPILGALFRKTSTATIQRELLIFVTARIIEPTGQPLIRD